MKRSLLFLLLVSVARADIITLTITVTNTPANNDVLTVNAAPRTNKTSVAVPALEVLVGASIGATTTNWFNQTASFLYPGPLFPTILATNQWSLRAREGQTITATASGTWCTLTLSTQSTTSLIPVRVPISGEPSTAIKTNIASQLIKGMFNDGFANNTVDATSPAMANFVNVSESQSVTGEKTFTAQVNVNQGAVFTATATNTLVFQMQDDGDMEKRFAMDVSGGIFSGLGAVAPTELYRFTSEDTFTNRIATWLDITNRIAAAHNFTTSQTFTGDGDWTSTYGAEQAAIFPANSSIMFRSTGAPRFGLMGSGNYLKLFTSGAEDNSLAATNLFQIDQDGTALLGQTGSSLLTGGLLIAKTTGAAGLAVRAESASSASIAVSSTSGDAYVTVGTFAIGADASDSGTFKIDEGIPVGSATRLKISPTTRNVGIGDPTFVASMVGGLQVSNGTSPSADPSSSFAQWSGSGEWKYRTGVASEGNSVENRVHNRGSSVQGSGTDFTIPDTAMNRADFGTTDSEVSLATAGTWFVTAYVAIINGATADDVYNVKLYNSTDAADVVQVTVSSINASKIAQAQLHSIVTFTSAKTIQIYVQNSTAARGTIDSEQTRITAIRLH